MLLLLSAIAVFLFCTIDTVVLDVGSFLGLMFFFFFFFWVGETFITKMQ